VLLSSGGLCNANLLIFRASRYVLWGEIKNLAFEDEKGKFSRNDFGTAKSCKIAGNFSTCLYIMINTFCTVALYPALSPV
jgi:hypothetical protein